MKRHIYLLLLTLLIPCALRAQEASRISVIESDSKMAFFAVEASAPKAADVAAAAMQTLFQTLLEQGVEGVNGGRPFMEVYNAKWKANFLKEKNPPYMMYVKGYQTEGDPLKSEVGDYRATVLVRVNIEFFERQLKNNGIMNK